MKVPFAGQLIERQETFDIYDKYLGTRIDSLPSMTVQDTNCAVQAARSAMSEMEKLTGHDRQEVIARLADSMLRNKQDLANTLIAETGMTTKQAEFEVIRASNILRLYSAEVTHLTGETLSLDGDARGAGRHGYWIRVPAGVVAAMTAFNNPLVQLAHKLGPAFAAGNTVVFKPASLAPLASVKACEAFLEAGCPPKALNVVTGRGEILGLALARNPHVRVIGFTGGRDAGEQIAKTAGTKKLLMELGSNCPNIVCSDADLDFAAHSLVDAAYSYQGQNCLHAQRILVQEDVYEDFRGKFINLASRLRMGDPRSTSTDIGPMISEPAAKRVEDWVNEAKRTGARLLLGGKRSGAFYEPTLLEEVPANARVVCEEVFGPVSILIRFPNIRGAVEIANSTEYGLQAAVFTNRMDNVLYAIENLAFGTVMINESTDFRVDMMPFGGFKGSGVGREGIKHSIEAMSEIKMIVYNLR